MMTVDAEEECPFCGKVFHISVVFEGITDEIGAKITLEPVVECFCGATFVGRETVADADEENPI